MLKLRVPVWRHLRHLRNQSINEHQIAFQLPPVCRYIDVGEINLDLPADLRVFIILTRNDVGVDPRAAAVLLETIHRRE